MSEVKLQHLNRDSEIHSDISGLGHDLSMQYASHYEKAGSNSSNAGSQQNPNRQRTGKERRKFFAAEPSPGDSGNFGKNPKATIGFDEAQRELLDQLEEMEEVKRMNKTRNVCCVSATSPSLTLTD